MPLTPNFSIFYRDTSTPASLETESALQADSIDDALTLAITGNRQIQTFRWADATARAAQTGMVVADVGYQTDTGVLYRYNGAAWKAWESDWIAYTPTLSAASGSWVIGTGGTAQNTGAYQFVNGTLSLRGRQFFGSSGRTVFTTGPQVSLPAGVALASPALANALMPGTVTIFDAGVASTEGALRYSGTQTDRVQLLAGRGSGITTITSTSPYTFGDGDGFEWTAVGLVVV